MAKNKWTFKQRPVSTKRMKLTPMSADELQELIDTETDPHMKKAYTEMRDGVLNHPGQEVWYTAWRMTLKSTGEMIGDLCFKGTADDKTVEIGYGVPDRYRGQGYTTEAVKALCEWAFSKEGVYFVRAITETGNAASERVLEKNKFNRIDGAEEGQTLWELEKPASSWFAIYMCLGLSVGMSLGTTVFDNSGMGLSIGLAIGLALGFALDAQDKKNRVRKGDKADDGESK